MGHTAQAVADPLSRHETVDLYSTGQT